MEAQQMEAQQMEEQEMEEQEQQLNEMVQIEKNKFLLFPRKFKLKVERLDLKNVLWILIH